MLYGVQCTIYHTLYVRRTYNVGSIVNSGFGNTNIMYIGNTQSCNVYINTLYTPYIVHITLYGVYITVRNICATYMSYIYDS